MSIDLEYAIKKDVRNNPVVREADRNQRHEFFRTAGIWALILGMFLFAAWQHFQVIYHGFQIEQVLEASGDEEAINRRLRLQIETLRAPERIERIAREHLHMVVPDPDHTLVIERVAPTTADRSVVASAQPGGVR